MSAHDFSLEILVDVPADGPPKVRVHVDEHAATKPFTRIPASTRVERRPLPGVDLRPAQQRPGVDLRRAQQRPGVDLGLAQPRTEPVAALPSPAEPAPLSAPRHVWLTSSSGRHPVPPSRQRARSLLGVPPPPTPRASPLSDDDGRRMARRARAYKRAAWANDMLEKLFTERAD